MQPHKIQPKYTISWKIKIFIPCGSILVLLKFWCLYDLNTHHQLIWMLWIRLKWQREELYWMKHKEQPLLSVFTDVIISISSTSVGQLFPSGITHRTALVSPGHGGVHVSAQRSGWKHHQRRLGAAEVGVQGGHSWGPEQQHHLVQRVVQLPGEEWQTSPRWDSDPPSQSRQRPESVHSVASILCIEQWTAHNAVGLFPPR